MIHQIDEKRRDDTNLSSSRALDGVSENATSILAIDPPAIRLSDSIADTAKASAIAPTARTSRRGFLMNSLVSTASLATAAAVATPTIASAMTSTAPAAAADDSPAEALRRAEEIVDILRTCVVRSKGWKVDEAAAERALAYCRANAANGADPDDERQAALDFFYGHGQSLDWVFGGRLAAMICKLAANSQRAASLAVAADPIFAAIEAHRKECVRNSKIFDFELSLEDDDPSKPAAEAATLAAMDEMFDLALELLAIRPTTRAGAAALLDHASRAEEPNTGEDWRFPETDANGKAFYQAMMKHVADALGSIGADDRELHISPPLSEDDIDRDAKLIELTDQFIDADWKYRELNDIVNQMDTFRTPCDPLPDVLRWRKADGKLGLPNLMIALNLANVDWHDETQVEKIRRKQWFIKRREKIKGHPDKGMFNDVQRFVVPSKAARRRADEIIAAYDEWTKGCVPPRGYKKAVRERDRASKAAYALLDKILDTRAKTVDGMMRKVSCAHSSMTWERGETLLVEDVEHLDLDEIGDAHEIAVSLFRDLQRMYLTVAPDYVVGERIELVGGKKRRGNALAKV